MKIISFVSTRKLRVLDIGCGEGWVMGEFDRQGHDVWGIDFSSAGLEKYHQQLLSKFEQGNLYELLDRAMNNNYVYDVVILANVIEHVIKPDKLLEFIKQILNPDGILTVVAPNDFSPLQIHLLSEGYISSEWWLAYPDHLSYFNKETMTTLLIDKGFQIKSIVADNPIDLNVLNDNSNYIEDKTKGKKTHLFRVRSDNFLGSIDKGKLLQMYEILGSIGVGRDLTYYCGLT